MHDYSLRRDYLLWTLVAAAAVLTALAPRAIDTYPRLIDWPTIETLAGLLLLTAAIEASGALHALAARIADRVRTERQLALVLVFGSALLAAVLTNDVALFVTVPLTLRIGAGARVPLRRLVVFEALAVNAGSTLTPIGNPQNIFLWQSSGVHVPDFLWALLAPAAICAACLFVFTVAAFRPIPLARGDAVSPGRVDPIDRIDRRRLALGALAFVPFIALADFHVAGVGLAALALAFAFLYRDGFRRVDWPLLAVFVLMFVDLGRVARLGWVTAALHRLDLSRPATVFLSGAILSQGISNVPATLLLSHYTRDWRSLAWGADIGGFGTVIGSLANLIALRLGRQRGGFRAFHAWSLPFFAIVFCATRLLISP